MKQISSTRILSFTNWPVTRTFSAMMKLVYSQETERILEPKLSNLEDMMGGYEDEVEMRPVGRYNPYLNDPNLSICQMELCPFDRFVLKRRLASYRIV